MTPEQNGPIDREACLVKALEDMVLYAHRHDGWRDDHPEILKNAEDLLAKIRAEVAA